LLFVEYGTRVAMLVATTTTLGRLLLSGQRSPCAQYGPVSYDVRHNFNLSAIYELPFGKRRTFGRDWSGATNAVLGDWTLSSIFKAHTGLALTVIDFAAQSLQEPPQRHRQFPRPRLQRHDRWRRH
jgi:hypothetical protein